MSHRDQILKRLEEAGRRGVHSFQLLDITPRYAARICELNKLGHHISSVPEKSSEAIGVRYTLNVGVESDGVGKPRGPGDMEVAPLVSTAPVTLDSGVADSVTPLPEAPPGTSMYDPFEAWAA
jgi:hypothetical protein